MDKNAKQPSLAIYGFLFSNSIHATSQSLIKSGAATSKPKTAPKATTQAQKPPKPKRSTRNIPGEEKNKAPVPEVEEEEEDEAQVLRKLKPKIPDHNDTHPVAEDMNIRNDVGLILWRQSDPYV